MPGNRWIRPLPARGVRINGHNRVDCRGRRERPAVKRLTCKVLTGLTAPEGCRTEGDIGERRPAGQVADLGRRTTLGPEGRRYPSTVLGTSVRITIEAEADLPQGASDELVRSVTQIGDGLLRTFSPRSSFCWLVTVAVCMMIPARLLASTFSVARAEFLPDTAPLVRVNSLVAAAYAVACAAVRPNAVGVAVICVENDVDQASRPASVLGRNVRLATATLWCERRTRPRPAPRRERHPAGNRPAATSHTGRPNHRVAAFIGRSPREPHTAGKGNYCA